MKRRSFLKLPALLPLIDVGSAFRSAEHHFQYESVIGTSMDLIVCSPQRRIAEGACRTVRREIDRLAAILDTRDPASEISRLERSDGGGEMSPELADVLGAYGDWERCTCGVFSIRPAGEGTPRNVDALGKGYILDRAAAAALKAWPSLDGLVLNIGGDIVMKGPSCEIAIADPAAWYDNAQPIATIDLRNMAVATSGTYARGAHLRDPLHGRSPATCVAATVVAPDAVTANALATTLCLTSADKGLQLVESIPGAQALRIESGVPHRTSGFALLERPVATQTAVPSSWPAGYQLTLTVPLTTGRSSKRPYAAVWVEDASGTLVRVLAMWGTKSKYYPDLSALWGHLQGNVNQLRSVTRATRPAGKYDLVWDGLDEAHKPTPPGSYRITVETNQEHGTYAKQVGSITLGDRPATITLPATTNFDTVIVQYRATAAMKHVLRVATHWALLLHIYVSMAGFTLAILFGSTGLALNHQDFGFSRPTVATSSITVDKDLVDRADQGAIEEWLRRKLNISSPSTDYHEDAELIQTTFAVPGRRTVVTINRKDGRADVEGESRGVFGKLGDLHKGFDTGDVWSWTIDVAALLIVTSSLTGIVTLLALRARRRNGFIVGGLGVVTVLAIYMLWVPK